MILSALLPFLRVVDVKIWGADRPYPEYPDIRYACGVIFMIAQSRYLGICGGYTPSLSGVGVYVGFGDSGPNAIAWKEV